MKTIVLTYHSKKYPDDDGRKFELLCDDDDYYRLQNWRIYVSRHLSKKRGRWRQQSNSEI